MDTNEIREYQTIAAYLLEKHFGLTLNDTNLHDDAVVLELVELNVPVFEAITRSLAVGAEPEEQLFNVNRFDMGRKSGQGKSDSMGIYPIRAFFRRISKECRFTVSPHRFRHTVATNLMKSPDRNIQAVKRLLGHSSLRSTLEYIDEDVDSLRDILEQELKR